MDRNEIINNLICDALELAETGRRDQEALSTFWKASAIHGVEEVTVHFVDEDGDEYTERLKHVPYLGNRSARLVKSWSW